MTREDVDRYWDERQPLIVEAYTKGETTRAEMMQALRDLAFEVDVMMQRVEYH